jgi:hypothetical protein
MVLRCLLVVPIVLCIAACNPALNWREVRLQRLVATLPCKPDHAQRTVQLASQEVAMDMLGCEADGALFAISHVRLDRDARTDAARADWRQQALATMRAASVQELPFRLTPPAPAGGAPSAHLLAAQGQRPDGGAVAARLLWLDSGPDLFHVAVYANPLSEERVEMLFSGLRLQ